MLHRFFTGLHRRCPLFVHDLHSLFITRKFSVISGCVLIAIVILAGCGKPAAPSSESDSKAADASTNTLQAASEPLLKFHWIGKKRLATEANATNFMAIWNLPESARLEAQTLDKLATAPWRLWQTNVALSNAPSHLLRPLLDDLVQEEIYLEATGGSNQISELVIALRLPDDRAALWETNLSALSTGIPDASARIRIGRAQDWSVVTVSFCDSLIENEDSAEQILNRLAVTDSSVASDYWITFSADLRWLLSLGGNQLQFENNIPAVTFQITGDGQGVRTSGDFRFLADLKLKLEPWSIPTNLIYDPLVSFTAFRGIGEWIHSQSWWRNDDFGPAPNQLFFWAQSPALWQHFMTFPVADASNFVSSIGKQVIEEWNPIFQTNRVGRFDWNTNRYGLIWMGVPFFKPVLEPTRFNSVDHVLVGLFSNNATNRAAPSELFAEFRNRTNLIYYDWELTPPQMTSWTQMGQLIRMIFGYRQMSPATASLPWLRAIAPHLGNASTIVLVENPQQLAFRRSSTFGFTSVELQLLADWLESPQFPAGLHTLLSPRPNFAPKVDLKDSARRNEGLEN